MAAASLAINTLAGQNMAIGNKAHLNEPPKAEGYILNFATANILTLDVLALIQQGFFSIVQTIYVDNSQNDVAMIINIPGSLQVITAKGRTQGFYNVLFPVGCHQFSFTAPASGLVTIFLVNVLIPGVVWATA